MPSVLTSGSHSAPPNECQTNSSTSPSLLPSSSHSSFFKVHPESLGKEGNITSVKNRFSFVLFILWLLPPSCSILEVWAALPAGAHYLAENVGQEVISVPAVMLPEDAGLRHHWPRSVCTSWHWSPHVSLISRVFPYFLRTSPSWGTEPCVLKDHIGFSCLRTVIMCVGFA